VIAYIQEGGVHKGGVDGVMGGRGEVELKRYTVKR